MPRQGNILITFYLSRGVHWLDFLQFYLSACNAGHKRVSDESTSCEPCGNGYYAARGANECTRCGDDMDTNGTTTAASADECSK